MEVQRELSEIIRSGIKDPRIHPMTSVVAVEVTPDLKYCKAYISVLGDEEAAKATVKVRRLFFLCAQRACKKSGTCANIAGNQIYSGQIPLNMA